MQIESKTQNIKLGGRGISGGLAIGKAFVYKDILQHKHILYDITKDNIEDEYQRIQDAIQEVVNELKESADIIEENLEESMADIFRAQKALLEDKTLLGEFRKELEAELVNAEEVVKRVLRRLERRYAEMDKEVFRQRGEDLNDLARRLFRSLSGIKAHTLEKLPDGSVLVACHLVPSNTVFLSRKSAVAVVVEIGGAGSHAALLTREMAIPAVTQISDVCEKINTGDTLLVDGNTGKVIVNPDTETKSKFKEQINQQKKTKEKALLRCHETAKTKDGTKIQVMANIGCFEDAESATANGADEIGLYRLEQLYLSRTKPLSEQGLLENVERTLSAMQEKTVTIRLLDAGADKDIPFLNLPAENNPFLGRRGVRLLLEYPDLTKLQLKVMLKLSQNYNIRILVPMVTVPEDMKQMRELLKDAANEIENEIDFSKLPLLGAMVETPAAVMCLKETVKYADFLSIGTNDLTQFTMAAGRENNLVSNYYIEDHPAVLKLIAIAIENSSECPIEVCGELASNFKSLQTLLKLGIKNLSVPPSLVPEIKEAVREIVL
jgi:phosphotransferase system enzyme I (PtsI)